MAFSVFPGHEIAFAQSGVQVGPLGGDFHAGFEQRDRVLKIILRHADPGQQKDDVSILRRQLVGLTRRSMASTTLVCSEYTRAIR